MTHSEFNHLLGSINSLSQEQMRQLRYELDTRLMPQQPLRIGTPQSSRLAWTLQQATVRGGSHLANSGRRSPTWRIPNGRAVIPIRANPYRKPSSESGVEWRFTFWTPAPS